MIRRCVQAPRRIRFGDLNGLCNLVFGSTLHNRAMSLTTSAVHEQRTGAIAELTPNAIDEILAESSQARKSSSAFVVPRSPEQHSPFKIIRSRPWRADARSSSATVQEERRPTTQRLVEREYPEPEEWKIQKRALKQKFGDAPWEPKKRLSPDALAGIRAVHAQFPGDFTTEKLAAQFEVSPEVIRRILKSSWVPKPEEAAMRQQRWFRRGEKIWERYAEQGLKPPQKWRITGIGIESRPRRRSLETSRVDGVVTTKRKPYRGNPAATSFV
jgi:hypothetical protein